MTKFVAPFDRSERDQARQRKDIGTKSISSAGENAVDEASELLRALKDQTKGWGFRDEMVFLDRLIAYFEVLRAALRGRSIKTVTVGNDGGFVRCDLCERNWCYEPERHAPGCLAAPLTPTIEGTEKSDGICKLAIHPPKTPPIWSRIDYAD